MFIAYAHGDLKTARYLRRRMSRLRKDRDPATIFLDQDSLSPGQDVNPDLVDQALAASDLVIVLCGRDTACRPEVMREVRQALMLRREGQLKILPVIMSAGVVLPDGLDYRVQGIFLTALFPSLVIVPAVAAAVIVVLTVTAGFLYAKQEPWLGAVAEDVDQQMEATPRPDYAVSVLAPIEAEPVRGLVSCGRVIIGATSHHLFTFDIAGGGPSGDYAVPEGQTVDEMRPLGGDRVAYVLRHAHFADATSAAEVEVDGDGSRFLDGDRVLGGERTLHSASCSLDDHQMHGFATTLEWRIGHDAGGDEAGPSWYEPIDQPETWSDLGYGAGEDILASLQELEVPADPEAWEIRRKATLLHDTPGSSADLYALETRNIIDRGITEYIDYTIHAFDG